jgi:hypothetical protein
MEIIMTKNVIAGTAFLLLAGASGAAAADQPKPAKYESAVSTIKATVKNIDYAARTITLKGSTGKTSTMDVGPEVVRFNEIKKGDQVEIQYLESVGISVHSPHDKIASAEGTSSVVVRNESKEPSGTKVTTEVVTASVVQINAKTRKATLRGPSGDLVHIDVAPDVEHLENVKKGDQVVVTYTRSLAIDIKKP